MHITNTDNESPLMNVTTRVHYRAREVADVIPKTLKMLQAKQYLQLFTSSLLSKAHSSSRINLTKSENSCVVSLFRQERNFFKRVPN